MTTTKSRSTITSTMAASMAAALKQGHVKSYFRPFVEAELIGGGPRHLTPAQREECRQLARRLSDEDLEHAVYDGCLQYRYHLSENDRIWAGNDVRNAIFDEAVRRGFLRIEPPPAPSLMEEDMTTASTTLLLCPLGHEPDVEPEGLWEYLIKTVLLVSRERDSLTSTQVSLLAARALWECLTPTQRAWLPEECQKAMQRLPDGLEDRVAAIDISEGTSAPVPQKAKATEEDGPTARALDMTTHSATQCLVHWTYATRVADGAAG